MTIGIIGQKRGMTRVFNDSGESVPVTVIEATPNRVTRLLTEEAQGYRAVQVTWGSKKASRLSKAQAGQFAKADVEAGEGLFEFRLNEDEETELNNGSEITVDIFEAGQKVDVAGTSIGKGFSGVIKRHNFSHQRNSHGNSISHRAPGSIGQCQTPGRVFKGKKMAGHYGNAKTSMQNLEVVRVDADRNLILVKGAVPSAKGGRVVIKPAVKVKK